MREAPLQTGDTVRVTLPGVTRAGLVEWVHEGQVRVWFPNTAEGFAVTVAIDQVERVEAK